ncbi:nucleotidyl transferase AbiEii/AbiGii toxin family protein [Wenzhouxiangella sp. XN24]|uniref:nucleotidyl transferase AbiEii/AbiGii toxin family protein n=1 Tax=Wenzhouxiangella sp. XN24 TaxID=2713569 RepID=UPI0013ED8670|nr:nucleotidyl transferase AbiEii/AbiGii toxin family protein [Wenzhouxiangella sp. XN24]NGX17150.1 nucleotidyl transferase AbiEii/AbiGii toxin family protein [Wenzhouxiangella sp. XN24]
MTFLSRISKALDAADVRYAVVGGYAVALHGAVRGTVDIDLVLRWTLRDLEAAEAALSSIGLVSRLPVTAESVFRFRDEYIRNRNLFAWNFYNPHDLSEQLDIVISEDLKGKRRIRIDTLDGPVQVLSRKDLIAMKRASGRPQDLADVAALEKLG